MAFPRGKNFRMHIQILPFSLLPPTFATMAMQSITHSLTHSVRGSSRNSRAPLLLCIPYLYLPISTHVIHSWPFTTVRHQLESLPILLLPHNNGGSEIFSSVKHAASTTTTTTGHEERKLSSNNNNNTPLQNVEW